MDRRRFRHSRGATLVEYALVVALIVVPSIGALNRVNSNSRDYYSNASDDIGDLPQTGVDNTPVSTTPSVSSSTTVLASTTTTAAPTTTTSPTTTTTIPTTTTTMPTTTTTLLRSRIESLTDISRNTSNNSYDARARVKIVRTDTGLAVNGASVTIRMVDDNGSTTTKTCATDSTGRCTVTWNRSDSRAPVTATVTSVTSSPQWDGAQQSVSLPHP